MSKKVFIIAEAGVNHNGDIEIAKELIKRAAEIGADAIKFQSFKASNLVTKDAKKAEYQNKNTNSDETQFTMLENLELDLKSMNELKEFSQSLNIMLISSPFDVESIDDLSILGLDILKIPSGEITNLPYLRKIGSLNKKIILSTGMSTLSDIENALTILRESGTSDISVLHCNTEYPTPLVDVNLNAMLTIKNAFKVDVGYSDHTEGIEVAIASVALGARIIEKHFTLDKNMEGPDHKASLEPLEFQDMIRAVRNIELALGDGIKRVSDSEYKNIELVRKSIVAKTKILKGQTYTSNNLTVKRPGYGLSPLFWDFVIGRFADRDYEEDEMITL